MMLEVLLVALALVTALLAQPWRMLRRTPLITPLLAILVILPWLWALPRLHAMPLQLQWSGACLAVLLLGWPLAIPALTLVALIAALLAQTPMDTMVAQLAWQGVVPATLALVLGALVRRWVGAPMSTLTTLVNHQVRLAQRPVGTPGRECWSFTEEAVAEPAEGGVLVKTLALSLDPAMRGWMNEGKSYIPPVGIGEVMRAGGVGTVVASKNPSSRWATRCQPVWACRSTAWSQATKSSATACSRSTCAWAA
jgi:hypothetical protein